MLSLHIGGTAGNDLVQSDQEIPMELLRKYITYARMKYQPRISEEAGKLLQNLYVDDRQKSIQQKVGKKSNGIPITVRQLEAIIRLSESICKIKLMNTVTGDEVKEAHRIFQISTLHAAASGMSNASAEAPTEL